MANGSFLDQNGLMYLWEKIRNLVNATKASIASDISAAKKEVLKDAKTYTDSKVTGLYKYKGSVTNATELKMPNEEDFPGYDVGDVYNIINKSMYGPPGMNVVWTGGEWDALGSSFEVSAMTNAQIDDATDDDDLLEETI